MSNTLLKELPTMADQADTKICVFCNKKEDDELHYGKFHTSGKLSAHYYCLLFSSGLEQKGKDDEGIQGFLNPDIEKEVKRGTKLKCSKCQKTGATVGCCNKICKRTYHFPCGSEARMLNQYFGAFNSFCINHQPVQKVPEPVLRGSPGNPMSKLGRQATCTICHEEVIAKPSYDVLWAPCCKKQSWFHRPCVQKLALSAGYFFKCPMCSDTGLFHKEMKDMGIYVPEQDASWELEPNAFHELIERHNQCDHPNCICPKGRTHDGDGTRWELMLCNSCGSKGLHIGCGKLEWNISEWDCEDCSKLVGKSSSSHSRRNLATCFEAVPSSSLVVIGNSARQSALKRPHPDDEQRNSSDDESEVDIIASNSSGSIRYDSNPSPPPRPAQRNVARRGGRGSWNSRRAAPPTKQQRINLDNLRFRVNDDTSEIIVYIEREKGSPLKTYTIPVDRPMASPNKKWK